MYWLVEGAYKMTAQVPDILIIRGKRHILFSDPLRKLLHSTRKTNRPKLKSTSTACYRGYVALWEIRDEHLYLLDLNGFVEQHERVIPINLERAMPWLKRPVLAKWVSGELRCPEGRLVSYVHHPFQSEYERDRILSVDKGVVLNEELRINPPEPIWHSIAADGSRTRLDERWGQPAEDLFAPNETPTGHRYWGQPMEGPEPEPNEDHNHVACWFGTPPSPPR